MSPRQSTPLENPTPPTDDVIESPSIVYDDDAKSVKARTPTPIVVDENPIPTLMDEVIQNDEPVILVEMILKEQPLREMEVDGPELPRLPSLVPVAEEAISRSVTEEESISSLPQKKKPMNHLPK